MRRPNDVPSMSSRMPSTSRSPGRQGSMPKGSDVIARFLVEQGVESVFELVGGMIVHLLDSIHQDGRIRIVSMHHEQGAAFAAEGFARITGVPGVAMATSGPGAT